MFRGLAVVWAVILAGCFQPNAKDGAFLCAEQQGWLCPDGLQCDKVRGLCVRQLMGPDMSVGAVGTPDLPPLIDNSCDGRVRRGAFANLSNLGAVNGAGDEQFLTLNSDGTRLYWVTQNQLMTAALDPANPKAIVGSPSAVTIDSAPPTILGGSFGTGDKFWLAGTSAGVTRLYRADVAAATHFTALEQHLPSATCPFSFPNFVDGADFVTELYLTANLAGCNLSAIYIAQGEVDRALGAFVAAIGEPEHQNATVLPGGLTLMFSTVTSPRMKYASRASTEGQWTSPTTLPMTAIGESTSGDVEALVNPACTAIYFVANRSGTHGGLDLWAADILPPS